MPNREKARKMFELNLNDVRKTLNVNVRTLSVGMLHVTGRPVTHLDSTA